MSNTEYLERVGPFHARYVAFLETIAQVRPGLHRYCARMTGSAMDGEDVVQDALFEAYRKLDKFDDSRPLTPWLFRIAHNRCIDFLRSRGVRDHAEATVPAPEYGLTVEPSALGIRQAIERLVITLPPKQRACVLLKDVFDYSLEEIAELVDSTLGGVKAALSRARTKLSASLPAPMSPQRAASPETLQVMQLYVERFNRRDWNGVRELISADARLDVADAFAGRLADAPYFVNYDRWSMPWRLALGDVEDEPVIIILQVGDDSWSPFGIIRLGLEGRQIDHIVDYAHCPWIIPAAATVALDSPFSGSPASGAN